MTQNVLALFGVKKKKSPFFGNIVNFPLIFSKMCIKISWKRIQKRFFFFLSKSAHSFENWQLAERKFFLTAYRSKLNLNLIYESMPNMKHGLPKSKSKASECILVSPANPALNKLYSDNFLHYPFFRSWKINLTIEPWRRPHYAI